MPFSTVETKRELTNIPKIHNIFTLMRNPMTFKSKSTIHKDIHTDALSGTKVWYTDTRLLNDIDLEYTSSCPKNKCFNAVISITEWFSLKFKTTLLLNNYSDYLIPVLRGIGFVPIPLIVFYSLERLDISIFTTILMTTPFFLYFWSLKH